jgi:hypothetical protein
MKYLILSLLVILLSLFVTLPKAQAVYDPLSRPNNMYGIHILFPEEIDDAAELVNSDGGQWGYVTIPIQMGDYDLDKWQSFLDKAKDKKLIPIVRLMTEPYWKNTNVWRIPDQYDIIDMANFLNSLNWPVQNRYIIVFNETNRSDEWGGENPDPKAYADILDFTVDVFKKRSQDFFMIMGGMDNAAPNELGKYMESFAYLRSMGEYKPDVFKKIDGFSSHSYPNPGFAQSPNATNREGTATYKYEYDMIHGYAGSAKPVFITETGWNAQMLGEAKVADYYKDAFVDIWGKDADKIVAVTPFLLHSHGGFDTFSFFINNQKTKYYDTIASIPKYRGDPIVNIPKQQTLAAETTGLDIAPAHVEPIVPMNEEVTSVLKFYFKTILGIR